MNIRRSFAAKRLLPALAAAAVAASCAAAIADEHRLALTSATFASGATLPGVTAYDGCASDAANRSPALAWSGAPERTQGYAVTLFDPDAPTGHGFYHWLLFDVPASVTHLDAGAVDPTSHAAVRGAVMGRVDFGFSHYGGPCPPKGDKPHHYVFTVYALDVARLAGADDATTGEKFADVVAPHVLAKATLTGRFGR